MKKLLEEWLDYQNWCTEQETNRFPKKMASINGGSCVKVIEWDIEYNMKPTFNGFMDWYYEKNLKNK
jgi:hypothetical protein